MPCLMSFSPGTVHMAHKWCHCSGDQDCDCVNKCGSSYLGPFTWVSNRWSLSSLSQLPDICTQVLESQCCAWRQTQEEELWNVAQDGIKTIAFLLLQSPKYKNYKHMLQPALKYLILHRLLFTCLFVFYKLSWNYLYRPGWVHRDPFASVSWVLEPMYIYSLTTVLFLY